MKIVLFASKFKNRNIYKICISFCSREGVKFDEANVKNAPIDFN